MTFWKRIATLNIMRGRAMSYLTILNSLMILKVYLDSFKNQNLGLGLIVVGVIVFLIVGIIDFYRVYPQELTIQFEKNTEWRKFRDGNN